jgi:hypothetical protein
MASLSKKARRRSRRKPKGMLFAQQSPKRQALKILYWLCIGLGALFSLIGLIAICFSGNIYYKICLPSGLMLITSILMFGGKSTKPSAFAQYIFYISIAGCVFFSLSPFIIPLAVIASVAMIPGSILADMCARKYDLKVL